MSDPVLLAVDDDASVRWSVEDALGDRYRSSYRVESARSPDEARSLLRGFAAAAVDVALVLHQFFALEGFEVAARQTRSPV
jgi:DNA-binding NtrC family response regulator